MTGRGVRQSGAWNQLHLGGGPEKAAQVERRARRARLAALLPVRPAQRALPAKPARPLLRSNEAMRRKLAQHAWLPWWAR